MSSDWELLARAARELKEGAQSVAADTETLIENAPRIVRQAPGVLASHASALLERARHAPDALQRAGRWAIDQVTTHPKPAPHPGGHPQAHRAKGPTVQTVPNAGKQVEVRGAPFMKTANQTAGADPDDVVQNDLNDCWMLAAMAAMAHADPASIQRLIKDLGGGKYEVTLYTGSPGKNGLRTAEKFVIDDHFVADDQGNPRGASSSQRGPGGAELWPRLIEKAIAVKKHGYDGLVLTNHGLTARVKSGLDFLQNSGHVDRYLVAGLTEDRILELVSHGAAAHRPMTSMALDPGYLDKYHVESFHHYTVMGANPAARTIDLRNPWGSHHLYGMKVADYAICFTSLEIGPTV